MKLTQEHFRMIGDLKDVTFQAGSFDKRFSRWLFYQNELSELTEKQIALIPKIHHRYRRQIRDYEKRYGEAKR